MPTYVTFQIGDDYASLADLRTLGIVDPMPDFSPYSKETPLEAGGNRGAGSPTATWTWNFISSSALTVLRGYRTDVTTRGLVICTWMPQRSAYVPFLVDMIWPRIEKETCGKYLGFILAFVNLIEIVIMEEE